MTEMISQAVSLLRKGGVIAYPTEFCFGLGCDPLNKAAVERLLKIKHRSIDQGLILVAANQSQVDEYADLDASPIKNEILLSWPGAVTWTLPARSQAPAWLKGQHPSIAMRVTAHALCSQLCQQFGHAIVSTSANRHGQAALLSAEQVLIEIGEEVDFIIEAQVGGAKQASTIRDGVSGKTLR